ncbi:hypothetical protein [Acidithiobacillus caldus]|uniref:Permuted papain-like amidase enzyme, YaeF/YiiX, C92 family n=3 Tax=Acidithiobacillus caldus TaxID=33059 RepID=F9ZS22_ACICS|nr:hypothetical protein [Acidithiobacillus caldus]AEK58831.1 conserved hypothetical protein [Acidithiobacillus caldus SM-1]AIA55867.1 hypothetical protein Acaty_c2010 [Acidithiobacillus caldus ATCC 51756]AUW33243.1 hypothetical protein A5904_10320 [Acidithiobacillus caldus]MBU2729990.1 hypothetical protein [Acidithiobacillus caldus]MBU2736602.1 hypothetical protein [Acidithiobacillus caldus ATCC 51756]
MVAVDVLFRASYGVEARLLRQRPKAGRWTHVGMVFRDGWVFHCDARRGVCGELWPDFLGDRSRDLGRVILPCSRPGENRLRSVCEDMAARGLAFADDYCDWQESGQRFYCTTVICEVLARAWGFVPLAPAAIPRQIVPLLGERRLLLPQQLHDALVAQVGRTTGSGRRD